MPLALDSVWVFLYAMLSLTGGQKPASAPETFRPSYGAGAWTRMSLRQDVVYRREIVKESPGGGPASEVKETENLGFEVVFKRVALRTDGSRDMEVEFRSKWRQAWRDGTALPAADYSSAVGKTMTFRLLPDGTVEGLTGHAGFPAVMDPATGTPIPNSDFRGDILYLFPRFPTTPISIGSTWEAPLFVAANPARPAPMYQYTLLGRATRNGEDCLRIAATFGNGIAVYDFSLAKGMIVAKSLSWQGSQSNRTGERLLGTTKTLSMYEAIARFE